jgi:Holliday junction DNA helicase RuvB
MGMMNKILGDDPGDGKDPSDYQEPLSVEDFLKAVEKKGKPKTVSANQAQQGVGNQTQPQAAHQGPGHTKGTSDNKLRPTTLAEFIGQEKAKKQLQMFIDGCKKTGRTLPHVLLATGPGMGKTTLATIIANEMGRTVYWEKAPISVSRLLKMMKILKDGDVIVLDEIHLQAKGRVAGNSPEALYHIMEDKKILTEQGLFNYPDITIIGCTTDRGLLPKSFADRFTICPPIEGYGDDDMVQIAELNAKQLEVGMDDDAKRVFAGACQWTPRVMNNFVTQSTFMADVLSKKDIDKDLAELVLDNQSVEHDGLTHDHMKYLTVLSEQLRWFPGTKEWHARAAVKTITLGMGISDTKFVSNEIEPLLIRLGLVRIASARELTDKGFDRLGITRPVAAP